jgi:dethiobiotin synthetase
MQQTYFITGTDTEVGITVLTALLARLLTEQGRKVAAFKPICSGGRSDAQALHDALAEKLTLDEINPWHFRAAIAPSLAARLEKKSVSLAQALKHIRARQEGFAVTLVEGAGGLLSPLGNNFNSRDLMLALRAAPIIVAPNKLGVVNHLLLTLEALPPRCRDRAKVVFMSPARADSATATNARLLGEFFPAKQTFALPWLGTRWQTAQAIKMPSVKRLLQALLRA